MASLVSVDSVFSGEEKRKEEKKKCGASGFGRKQGECLDPGDPSGG